MKSNLEVKWVDGGREPKCAPDPRYPEGVDLKVPHAPHCETTLPYPSPRCGFYLVTCTTCGIRVAITAAGRADDPRSVQIPCKGH